jgi:ABC-type oligopeptide transport system, periplasmic component
LRVVDPVQYRARVEDFDFDMTIERFSMSATPGDAMRPFFSAQAAATKGSYNLAGIANPAIDALIEKIIGADSRADLTVACRAFDGCFAPAAIGCRNGIEPPIRSPIGTCSPIPRSCRVMPRASVRRRCGGTIRARRPKPSRPSNS